MTYFKTADDEEPKCSECAHYTECNGKNCGPEHWWAYYIRYVIEEEEYDQNCKTN